MLLLTCHCSARCFYAECAIIPGEASAKLHNMQFLCIAKRVTVDNVNSNSLTAAQPEKTPTGIFFKNINLLQKN